MKTTVYIDGFNFYYGLLKSGPHKWLDYYKLFAEYVLPSSSLISKPTSLKIKFFTAPTKANFHPRGASSAQAQAAYWRALEKYLGDKIEIIEGNHSPSASSAYPYCATSPKKPHSFDKVKVWKLEEKLTDVQLSLTAYRDVVKGDCEQVVICSNDSDISPALEALREDYTDVLLGVVFPIKAEGADGRRRSTVLEGFAHWAVPSISAAALAEAQLPNRVPTDRKPIRKPEIWG